MTREVVIDYTNWRGERAKRVIAPTGQMRFAATVWHPEPQWLMEAMDVEKGEHRLFAMKDIHAWEVRTPPPVGRYPKHPHED